MKEDWNHDKIASEAETFWKMKFLFLLSFFLVSAKATLKPSGIYFDNGKRQVDKSDRFFFHLVFRKKNDFWKPKIEFKEVIKEL